jgi:NTE family protein
MGDEPSFLGDLYQPLGPKALNFFNPVLDLSSTQLNVFVDQELTTELKLRSAVFELGGGRELLDWAEIRGGFRVGAGDTRFHVGDPSTVPYDSFHLGEVFARFSVDTLDNISFPSEGTFAKIEWRGSSRTALGADHDYDQLLLDVVHAKTWGRNTVLTSLRWDATISGRTPAYRLFRLGGFRDLSGLNSGEITGQHATRIGASYYRRIGNLALFPAFVGFSAEVGNVWDRRSDVSLRHSIWGGAIWAGVDTPAGPVFLAYGSAEGGRDAFYASLGRLF